MSTQVPIVSPSPMYQAESPFRSWQDSESSKPFLSPFRTPQYSHPESPQSPPSGRSQRRAPTWDPRWTIAQLDGQVPNTSHTLRDSGYASSPQRSKPEESHRPTQVTIGPLPTSPQSSNSDTLLGDESYDFPTKNRPHEPVHPQRHPSLYVGPELQPELVVLPPGDDYLVMPPPTPPASDTSLRSYVRRIKTFVSFVKSLPWMEKERCTADYYPGTGSHSGRHPKHRPMIIWHSQDYHSGDYRIYVGDSSAEEDSFYPLPSGSYNASPYPGIPEDLNLSQEFDESERDPPPTRPLQTTHRPPIDLSREFSTRPPQVQYPGGYVPSTRLPPQRR
jgi:hypothetical protein